MPGHDLTRYYPLLPFLAILAVVNPTAMNAITAALTLLHLLAAQRH